MNGKIGVFLCGGENCLQKGSEGIRQEMVKRIVAEGLEEKINLGRMRCLQMCGQGPNIILLPSGDIFNEVSVETLDQVLRTIKEQLQ